MTLKDRQIHMYINCVVMFKKNEENMQKKYQHTS